MKKPCGRALWGILSALVILDAAVTLSGLVVQAVWEVGKCLSSM